MLGLGIHQKCRWERLKRGKGLCSVTGVREWEEGTLEQTTLPNVPNTQHNNQASKLVMGKADIVDI